MKKFEQQNQIKIVCVVNNFKLFKEVVLENENMNKNEIIVFDNSEENIGISKRYNTFIDENIHLQNTGFWVVFSHQDFAFTQDLSQVVQKLDKKNIYGPVGVKTTFSIFKFFKNIFFAKSDYYPSFKFNFSGLNPFNKKKFLSVEKTKMSSLIYRKKKVLGQINQGLENGGYKKFGCKIKKPKEVSNLDCCCLIVHSSLIDKYKLRFDENLDWHIYVEEFCINAQKKYKLKTKALQLDCCHLGQGVLNDDFYLSADYVIKKHNLKRLSTTCIDY